MKKCWGVLRIWYVSTTCKSNEILLQDYYMNGKGKSKVLIKFLLNFRQSGDVFFFLNVRRLRGYTATVPYEYVPIFMCIVKDIYYIRIRKYAQQLKYMMQL